MSFNNPCLLLRIDNFFVSIEIFSFVPYDSLTWTTEDKCFESFKNFFY